MVPAPSILPLFSVVALMSAVSQLSAQEGAIPARPESRIHDAGSIFGAGDHSRTAEAIQGKLEALKTETGCDVLVATVTSTTGTSPRALAEQFAVAWLNPAQNGAVLVYDRAGNQFAIAATDPVRDAIPDYFLASIEQASRDREDAAAAEIVALAASDLEGVLRKYFGNDADRNHPSIKADRILMGVVAACIVVMIAVVASLHWRGEKARA